MVIHFQTSNSRYSIVEEGDIQRLLKFQPTERLLDNGRVHECLQRVDMGAIVEMRLVKGERARFTLFNDGESQRWTTSTVQWIKEYNFRTVIADLP
jgi:hypothetical protein